MLEGVEAHVAARMGELVKPLDDSGNAAARQEFIKGEIAGIQTFQAFPQSLVESAEAKIMDLASQIEDEESNGN